MIHQGGRHLPHGTSAYDSGRNHARFQDGNRCQFIDDQGTSMDIYQILAHRERAIDFDIVYETLYGCAT